MKRNNEPKKYRTYISPYRLSLFAESKEKYIIEYFFKGEPKKPTPAMEKGTACHELFYNILKGDKEFVVEKSFSPLRADAKKGISPEEAKANRDRRDAWLKEVQGKEILTGDLYGVKIRLEAFFKANPETYKISKKAIEEDTFEKLIFSDTTEKLKGYPDIVGEDYIIDIKSSETTKWIEEGQSDEFFKWQLNKLLYQQIIYQRIMEEKFGRKFGFRFLLMCSKDPYTIKCSSFEDHEVKDVKALMDTKIIPQYHNFNDQVIQAFGYNFLEEEKYHGDEEKAIRDLVKLNKILGNSDDKVELVSLPYHVKQKLEIELGYVKQ